MIEKKEDEVRRTPLSQVLISTRIRNLEDRILHQKVHPEDQLLFIAHTVGGNIKESWRLTCACLVCGSNEHKVKDCPRTRSFTTPDWGYSFNGIEEQQGLQEYCITECA